MFNVITACLMSRSHCFAGNMLSAPYSTAMKWFVIHLWFLCWIICLFKHFIRESTSELLFGAMMYFVFQLILSCLRSIKSAETNNHKESKRHSRTNSRHYNMYYKPIFHGRILYKNQKLESIFVCTKCNYFQLNL
jgi:hypothetical protein